MGEKHSPIKCILGDADSLATDVDMKPLKALGLIWMFGERESCFPWDNWVWGPGKHKFSVPCYPKIGDM